MICILKYGCCESCWDLLQESSVSLLNLEDDINNSKYIGFRCTIWWCLCICISVYWISVYWVVCLPPKVTSPSNTLYDPFYRLIQKPLMNRLGAQKKRKQMNYLILHITSPEISGIRIKWSFFSLLKHYLFSSISLEALLSLDNAW